MKRLVLGMLIFLSACSRNETAAGTEVQQMKPIWSVRDVPALGYTYLHGNILLAGNQIRAVNIRHRKLEFSLNQKVDYNRTSFSSIGDDVLAMERGDKHSLLIFDKFGSSVSSTELLGGGISTHQQGPYVIGDSVYAASGPTVYKYDVKKMRSQSVAPEWSITPSSLYITSFLAVGPNQIIFGTDSNRLVSVDGEGKEIWSKSLDLPGTTLAAAYVMGVHGDQLIVQAGRNGLQSYNLKTGQRTWNVFPSVDVCPSGAAPVEFQMEIADGMIFFGHAGGSCVLAFHADDGKLAWIFDAPTKGTFDTKPIYVNGVVYANNSRLWALEAKTGKLIAATSADQYLGANFGAPLNYDPVENQIITWGNTGVYAYDAIK